MFRSHHNTNPCLRVIVVRTMTLMLVASASIRNRSYVAAFSSIDLTGANKRSFQSSRNQIPSFQTSTYSRNNNLDFCYSGAAWCREARSLLWMSTSSLASASADSTVLRRVKAVDATEATDGDSVLIKGWVRTVRKQKTLAFVEVNDGSNMSGIQCVLSFDSVDKDTKEGTMI